MYITYRIHRTGEKVVKNLSHYDAVNRLAFLDEQERITALHAPTDSGDTRLNYRNEAEAIRKAIRIKLNCA